MGTNTIQQKIARHYTENDLFLKEFNEMMEFYFHRFGKIIKAKDDRKDFQESFIEYMKVMIEQGYFMGEQFLNHEEIHVPDDFLCSSNNTLKEKIIVPLDEATNGFNQSISTDISASYEAALIDLNEKVETELYHARLELAYFGVLQAFLDERKRRNLKPQDEPGDDMIGYLNRIDDLHFLDPRKYLQCLSKSETSEIWQLTPSLTNDYAKEYLGSLTIHYVSKNRLQRLYNILPVYSDSEVTPDTFNETMYLNLQVHSSIDEDDIEAIAAGVKEQIIKRMGLSGDNIFINISQTDEFFTLSD